VITPEHSDQGDVRRPGRVGAKTIALGLVVVAGLTLITLTSPNPDDEAASATTTTSTTTTTIAEIEPLIDLENFSVDQITRGEPFAWESSLSVVEGFPIALLNHQETIYLFATDRPNFSGFDTGGLRAWRSRDGLTWESLGQVISGNSDIWPVTSTDQGLLALETSPDGPTFTVWRSEDGSAWEPIEPVDEDLSEAVTVYPQAVGGTDAVLAVAGRIEVNGQSILGERLGEIAAYQWDTIVMSDEVVFNLYGPFGRLAQITGEELGLTNAERQMFFDANTDTNEVAPYIWVKVGADDWRRTTIAGAHWIDTFATTPNGDLVAHGWGPNSMSSWTTPDGIEWHQLPPTTPHYLEVQWGDQVVAARSNGEAALLVSADGADWEDFGPGEHFPREIDWGVGGLAAGPGGVAVVVNGWKRNQEQWPEPLVESPSITSDDGTLTVDFASGEYRLDTGDGTHVWSGTSVRGIDVDLDRAMVIFSDVESDEILAEFPLEKIIGAQNEVIYPVPEDSGRYDAFAFTSDGEDWTIQTFDEVLGSSPFHLLAVTDTHVVATGLPASDYFDPSSPPGFEVWTASIP
jgi:hypothetical protein